MPLFNKTSTGTLWQNKETGKRSVGILYIRKRAHKGNDVNVHDN